MLTNGTRLSVRRLAFGFLAGFIAVLVFHELMLALLHAVGMTPSAPYNARPLPPFGVPQILSQAFWGGVWGVVFTLSSGAFRAARVTGSPLSCSAPSP